MGETTEINVPFETAEETGTCLTLRIPTQNLIRSFLPQEPRPIENLGAAAAYAIAHPRGCKPFAEMLRKGAKVAIMVENQFRAAPADKIIPPILDAVRAAGADPVIVIGNGKVPPLSKEEIERKVGKAAAGIPVHCNDVSKPENYAYLGTTSRGIPVFVLKAVAEADVKISVATTQATLWGVRGVGDGHSRGRRRRNHRDEPHFLVVEGMRTRQQRLPYAGRQVRGGPNSRHRYGNPGHRGQ
jgi:nickel-dependent lactate racemase